MINNVSSSAETALLRRRDERRAQKSAVHCYLDGVRFDSRTSDISAGGAFVLTDKEIELGTLIAVAFRHQPETEGVPVFLLGQVARQQSEPRGVGVRWVKACTRAPRLGLARFLAIRLQVAPLGLKLAPPGPDDVSESEYDFQVAPSPTLAGCAEQIAKVRAAQEEFAAPSARPAPKQPAAEESAQPGHRKEPGPMTRTMAKVGTMARARLKATVEFQGGEHKAVVVGLGMSRISVACRTLPPPPEAASWWFASNSRGSKG